MAKKSALGRGLGALIESQETIPRELADRMPAQKIVGVAEIDIQYIETNPYQPRTIFDEETLNELSESIRELGIIQPITVRQIKENQYQLISGERRLRASKLSGLTKIPAYIRKADDQNMLEMALVENIQRDDLDAIEVAISFQQLIEECKLTQELLSKRVGKKRATVANYLRLLKLPAEIQLGIKEKKITMGHARALVTIPEPKDQLAIYAQIIDLELSVRKVEELAQKSIEPKPTQVPSNASQEEQPKAYENLKNDLSKFFSSDIEFKRSNKGSGKIVISFNSDEDLERIIAIFDKLNA